MNENSDDKTFLERKLGFTETLSIIINRIIGSGIFRTPAPIMLLAGSVTMFYFVWVFGAIFTMLSALCYAEMVALIPSSGGPYAFLRAAYPPYVAFIRGWAMFFVSETGAIAAVSLFFAETLKLLFGINQFTLAIPLIAISLIWTLTIANTRGIVFSGKLQNISSLLKIGILVIVIVAGFSSGINKENFLQELLPKSLSLTLFLQFGEALRYGLFSYSGWEGATYVAEEVKNPEKNLPRSLISGIALVLILYLIVNSAYINLLPPSLIGQSKGVAVQAIQAKWDNLGVVFISIAILISTFTNVNTQILVKSRTWFAMARDKLFFEPLSKIDQVYHTPNNALYAQALWATALVGFASLNENAYETIIDYFTFTSALFNFLTLYALSIIRKKIFKAGPHYKTWGYPITWVLALTIQGAFLLITLITAPIPSLTGITLTLSGFIYFYFKKK